MNPPRLAIIRDLEQPPGGWRYTVPETGLVLRAATPKSLKAKIASHLSANAIDIPDDEELDHRICTQMGLDERFCGKPPPKPMQGVHPGLSPHLANHFMRTMLQVVYDRKFVDRAEADRRLAICNACPMACGIGGCWHCNGLFTTVKKLIRKDVGRSAPGKEWCGACGCNCELKSLIDNDTLDKAEGKDKPAYHESCWRLNR
jgi:hypothetical protein